MPRRAINTLQLLRVRPFGKTPSASSTRSPSQCRYDHDPHALNTISFGTTMFTTPRAWSPWAGPALSNPDRPSHHANDDGTAFKNPWPSADAPTWTELLRVKFPLGLYDDWAKTHPGTRDVKVVTPDWGAASLKERGLVRGESVVGTWLGHAGALAEMSLESTIGGRVDKGKKSLWVLYDPIFSVRAGPTQYTGPARKKPTPCQVADLPGCDVVMISHSHYDHLDTSTIEALFKSFPKARYFVPLGNKNWFVALGASKDMVYELDWWQNREYGVEDFGHTTSQDSTSDTVLRFTCIPSQHGSGRGVLDQNTTLWCGWMVEQLLVSKDEAEKSKTMRKGAIYHTGDTGYRRIAKSDPVCPIFKEVGEKFGPIDLSFIPMWRGGSLSFVSDAGLRLSPNNLPSNHHATPTDAIDIHKDIQSRNTVAVHFGTFVGSEEESIESIIDFEKAREDSGVLRLDEQPDNAETSHAGIIDIGASFAVEVSVHDITLG